ncbi:MAG: polysaccharide biosynthesis/export family protein [Pyrinomonadaceae bacterium]|nr:polysaccharide biosynthesis/export family protein [Pyrinomonadaceae bacterium]
MRAKIVKRIAITLATTVFLTSAVFSQAITSNFESNFGREMHAANVPKTVEANSKSLHPSMLYHIGPFDQVKISLLNANFAPRVLRVNGEGCINYPLAGEKVCLAGLTPPAAEHSLSAAIKLFDNTVVKIEILEYASHVINITGSVAQPGEQQITRDAVPFFVVRAGVLLDPQATSVRVIRNASQVTAEFRLSDPALSEIYIYPGDTVEFY